MAKRIIKSTEKSESVPVQINNSSGSISTVTDIPRLREQTRANMAKYIVLGLFTMLGILTTLLFVLIMLDKKEASVFKDILLSFIGFSSGILVSILGYYYKGKDIENN